MRSWGQRLGGKGVLSDTMGSTCPLLQWSVTDHDVQSIQVYHDLTLGSLHAQTKMCTDIDMQMNKAYKHEREETHKHTAHAYEWHESTSTQWYFVSAVKRTAFKERKGAGEWIGGMAKVWIWAHSSRWSRHPEEIGLRGENKSEFPSKTCQSNCWEGAALLKLWRRYFAFV